MHIPLTTPVGTFASLSGVGVSLHDFVGFSWHVLMPYAIFGAALMGYSQVRLFRGQRELTKQSTIAADERTPKA